MPRGGANKSPKAKGTEQDAVDTRELAGQRAGWQRAAGRRQPAISDFGPRRELGRTIADFEFRRLKNSTDSRDSTDGDRGAEELRGSGRDPGGRGSGQMAAGRRQQERRAITKGDEAVRREGESARTRWRRGAGRRHWRRKSDHRLRNAGAEMESHSGEWAAWAE
jgi:hypothetical protein